MITKLKSGALIFLLFLCLKPSPSSAAEETRKDIFDVPKPVAVQNRKYYLNKGLTLNLGYLPLDSFTKGLTAGASYAYYFSDFTAWEILNVNYVANINTQLKSDLISQYQVQPTAIPDFMQYYVTSNILYTPFYNKSLLFNKSVVWGETTFLAGAGVGFFKTAGIAPLIDLGFILKYFLTEKASVNFDVREHIAFVGGSSGVQGILYIGAGYTFQMGDNVPHGDAPKQEEEDALDNF